MDPNNYVGKDFLSMPKPHHHVSRLVVLLIILGVIVLITWLSVYLFKKNSPEASAPVQNNPEMTLSEEEWAAKQQAIKEMNEINATPVVLTKEEIAEKEAQIKAMNEINSKFNN